MRAGLLMVLVDALRWDYPERMRYLKSLSERSTTGRLVEPFGFTPRSAYFEGVDVPPGGFTHMFEWNPQRSPFGASRFLPELRDSQSSVAFRDAIRQQARSKTAGFVADYLDPVQIPLEYLRYFDVAERTCPWGTEAEEASLFALLRSRGQRSYVCAWPETNGLTDAAIVARTLHQLDRDVAFAFVHLSGLDGAGHVHGPGSSEVQRTLEETDDHLRTLVEHARSLWRRPSVIMFGDHGMVPVMRTFDVIQSLTGIGLAYGRDFAYFIDATTIRFWYFAAGAQERVRTTLSSLPGGHFLTQDERTSFGLDRAGWRNGEDFFLADPGVLFSPSFFGRTSLRGMHGYDPGSLDNQGAFLWWNPADETPRDAGPVRASRLFSTALAALAVPVPCGAPAPVAPRASQVRRRQYTAAALPHHEALVEQDLQRILARVLQAVPDCEAIVLTGSFGRGEGVVREHPALRAVNDYDLMVIGGRPREDLDRVRVELEVECHVDAIDLGWADPCRPVGPSQLGFDLRLGSRVLYGSRRVLDRVGTVVPAELTMADAWLGLSNRACGLLEVIDDGRDPDGGPSRLQAIKCAVAIGDACLIASGDYHVHIATRLRRLPDLARALGMPDSTIAMICSGYAAKLGLHGGDPAATISPTELFSAAADLARRFDPSRPLPQVAAAEAVRGRCRQCGVPPGEIPVLPPEFAADLESLYVRGWELFGEAAAGARPASWPSRRERLISRWRKVIH